MLQLLIYTRPLRFLFKFVINLPLDSICAVSELLRIVNEYFGPPEDF